MADWSESDLNSGKNLRISPWNFIDWMECEQVA